MIPKRLEINNFLPYRLPDPLHFDGIHLACLTGANGAGKSSLLDAMTWALWGKARTNRDDDLIHQGQTNMSVLLEFEQEGIVYEVRRQRERGKQGRPLLALFSKQADGNRTNLSASSIRATQGVINDILRLDYETFVHSAFLQQGRADAFTTKRPAERKRILSDILGLARWRTYEERAKEAVRRYKDQITAYDALIRAADDEIAQEPQRKRDKAAAEAAFEEAQRELKTAEARKQELAHAEPDLKHARATQNDTQRRLKNHESDLEAVEKDITARQSRIAAYEQVYAQSEQIEAGYQALQAAREQDSSLGEKLSQMSEIDQQISALQAELESARSSLEREQHGYQTQIQELSRAVSGGDAEAYEAVQGEIATLESLDAERNRLLDHISALKEEAASILAQQDILKDEGQTLNDRIAQLENVDDAICPLCGQPLNETHYQNLMADIEEQRDARRIKYRWTISRTNEIQREIKQGQDDLERMVADLKQLPKLQSQAGALKKQLDDAREAQSRLDEVQASLTAVEAALEQADYGHEIRAQLGEAQQARAAIGYNREAHQQIRTQMESYRAYEAQYTQLAIAQNALPAEREAVTNAQARRERLLEAIEQERTANVDLSAQIEQLKVLVAEYQRRSDEVLALRTRENTAREKLSAANQHLHAIQTARERKKAHEKERATAKQEQLKYDELCQAFGKNGVPAMIIETAIPELEMIANQLLTRMTDGRMHMRLTTQREKISGGVAETLDIEIADELGTRNYEMYSGGEAFRINFAIRVALSKMLARRAGAHLRTLFVDEGFGTQDDDGRNKLIEAITAIQEDFDMILVITHIDDLRDSFPVHIVVEKGRDGSRIDVR